MRPSVETNKVAIPEREELADALTLHSCLNNCYGAKGMAVSCCTLTDRNYIIGAITDADAFLARLSEREGRTVPREEVFVDYEEGRALFPDRPIWQEERVYPAMRPDLDDPALPCVLLGKDNLCTVHDIRPETCAVYYCSHLVDLLKAI